MELSFIAIASVVSVLTEVLKKAPKVPVNSGNAMVVVFVLAVIIAIGPALINGDLATTDADTLAQSVAVIFGAATILYEAVKKVWFALKGKLKK